MISAKTNLSVLRLRELLTYDPDHGKFTWLVSVNRRAKAGMVAGYKRGDGYWAIAIDGAKYPAHRLAWLYVYGEWPSKFIDHANGLRGDNRITNLRLATRSQNNHNAKLRVDNTSGFKGVCLRRRSGRWESRIKVNGQFKYLGSFNSAALADEAYSVAAHKHFAEFAGRT